MLPLPRFQHHPTKRILTSAPKGCSQRGAKVPDLRTCLTKHVSANSHLRAQTARGVFRIYFCLSGTEPSGKEVSGVAFAHAARAADRADGPIWGLAPLLPLSLGSPPRQMIFAGLLNRDTFCNHLKHVAFYTKIKRHHHL